MTQDCAIPECDRPVGGFDIALCYDHVVFCWGEYEDAIREQVREAKRRANEGRTGWLYFIQVGDKIKVGYAFRPHQRLRQYPPGSEILATKPKVTKVDEAEMHARLTQYRVAGREWYRDCDEVRAVVAEIVAEVGPPQIVVRWGDGQSRPRRSTRTAGRAASVVTGFTV